MNWKFMGPVPKRIEWAPHFCYHRKAYGFRHLALHPLGTGLLERRARQSEFECCILT